MQIEIKEARDHDLSMRGGSVDIGAGAGGFGALPVPGLEKCEMDTPQVFITFQPWGLQPTICIPARSLLSTNVNNNACAMPEYSRRQQAP